MTHKKSFVIFVLLLCLPILWVDAGPGESYIPAYNRLVKMLADRCEAVGHPTDALKVKDAGSSDPSVNSVTQGDLNLLRTNVIYLLMNHYICEQGISLNTNVVGDAFPFGLRFDTGGNMVLPSLMEGIGDNGQFTKVQSLYASAPIYANNFDDVPPLWIHFQELYYAISKMRTSVHGGQFMAADVHQLSDRRINVNSRTWSGVCTDQIYDEPLGIISPTGWMQGHVEYYVTSYGYYYLRWVSITERNRAYFTVSGLGTSVPHSVEFYNYATAVGLWSDSAAEVKPDQWHLWDSQSQNNDSTAASALLGPPGKVDCCDEPVWQGDATVSGFKVVNAVALVQWDFPVLPISNPVAADSAYDGLHYMGCAVGCSGGGASCAMAPTISWKAGGHGSAWANFPLGVTSCMTNGGIQVRAYIEDYVVDGAPLQMFSLDTKILKIASNPAEGWHFVVVKRPSGAEVTFSMAGPSAGSPVNVSHNYKMTFNAGAYELEFPASDNIVHRFEGAGSVSSVFSRNDPDVAINGNPSAWADMQIQRSGDQVVSVVCDVVSSDLMYAGNVVNHVDYKDQDGNVFASINVVPGSRRYRYVTQGHEEETRYLFSATNDVEEIWYGVSTNPTLSVAQKVIRQTSVNPTNLLATMTETTITDPDTPMASTAVVVEISYPYAWGAEVVCRIEGAGSTDTQTVYSAYHTNSAHAGSCGRLAFREHADGSWVRYEYDAEGRIVEECHGFKDAPPDALPEACRVIRRYYAGDPVLEASGVPADVVFPRDERVRLEVETLMGVEVARTYRVFYPDHDVTKRCATPGARHDASDNVVVTHYCFTEGPGIGRPQRIERADGTVTTYSYVHDSIANVLMATEAQGAWDGVGIHDGRRRVSVTDSSGNMISETISDVASGIVISITTNTYDALGRLVVTSNTITGLATEYTYSCCNHPETVRNAEGITTWNMYDDLKRLIATENRGVTYQYTYDARGRQIKTVISDAAGIAVTNRSIYDAAGRALASVDANGNVIATTYGRNDDGDRIALTTYADGSFRVESYYRDGRTKSVEGSAAHPKFYDYGADGEGRYMIEYMGSNDSATAWIKTYENMLGQTWKTVYPDGYATTNYFDEAGRIVRVSDGLVTTLTQYDARGDAFRNGVDMDGNGALTLDGIDRVDERQSGLMQFMAQDVERTVSLAYETAGSSETTERGLQYRAVDGGATWTIAHGRTTMVAVARDAATASRTESVTQPDGVRQASFFTNGLLMAVVRQSSEGETISETTYVYDGFLRLARTTEVAANGETRVTEPVYDAVGNVVTQLVSAGALVHITSHSFNAMGRRVSTTLPDGGVVHYEYAPTGGLVGQNGARTYPVRYTYDDQGRMVTMSTYRNGLSGPADVTSWQYDPKRGWLTAKIYADNTGTTYDYYPDGKLKKRTWARGVSTDYAYDAGGSLIGVSYSDTTPGVTHGVDRLGRIVTTTDAIGTWTNSYSPDGQLASVSLPQQPGHTLEYAHDIHGRLETSQVSGFGFQVSYTYDSAGRLAEVFDGTYTSTYTYAADGRSWTNLDFGSALTTRRTFDGFNRLLSIESVPSATSAVSFSYAYNLADQRTTNRLADGGYWAYAYDELGQVIAGKKHFVDGAAVGGAQYEYDFDTIGNRKKAVNNMGQLSLIQEYDANELNQYGSRTLPGRILNTGEAETDAVVVVSMNDAVAVVANRQGERYWQVLDVDNSTGFVVATNVVRARITHVEGGTTSSLIRTEARSVIVPKTPEPFAYDLDGNLISDGLWTYEWDGENRLIAMESGEGIPDAIRKRLEFAYDHQSRRTRKIVYSAYSNSVYTSTGMHIYVYDGWNMIAEYTQSSNLQSTNLYTWGLDLSQSLQGAGGIGGLLSITKNKEPGTTNSYAVAYDGNGNVMALISTNGTRVAEYEYSPFGEILRATGPAATETPFRFSTKYTDDETGFVYYGFRYYSPELGRWLSRDPLGDGAALRMHLGGKSIHEQEGMHRAALDPVYAFCGNDPVDDIDVLGLIYNVTVRRTKATITSSGISVNAGHQWIVYDGNSVGFWPNKGWIVERPDQATQPPIAYVLTWWATEQKKTGKMKWGAGKDIYCKCVIKWHVIDCLNNAPNPGWTSNDMVNNCRKFSWWAIDGCCLKKGKKTSYANPSWPVPSN